MAKLLHICNKESLKEILQDSKHNLPNVLKEELEKLYHLALNIHYAHCIVSPLYYAPMSYYNGLFFRFFANNITLILGGEYEILGQNACGFGIYTDNLIQFIKE